MVPAQSFYISCTRVLPSTSTNASHLVHQHPFTSDARKDNINFVSTSV